MNDLFPESDVKKMAKTSLLEAELAVVALKRHGRDAIEIARQHLENAIKALDSNPKDRWGR